MTAPVVAARATGRTTAVNVTSHAITMPTGIVAGNLLVVVFSVDGAPTITVPAAWTMLLGPTVDATNQVSGAVFWKVATGSDTLTVTTSLAKQSSHVSFRITGGASVAGYVSSGSSTNSAPPALGYYGQADHLWICTRSGDSTVVATAAPAGMTNLQTIAAVGTLSASTNTAEYRDPVDTLSTNYTPGTFTSTTEQWVCWTLQVHPPNPKISTVNETFSGVMSDPPWLPFDANSTFTGGQLVQTTPAGPAGGSFLLYDASRLDASASSIYCEIVDPGVQTAGTSHYFRPMYLMEPNGNGFSPYIWAGSIYVYHDSLGAVAGPFTYNPVTMRWLRFRVAGANYFYETSPDATTWTVLTTGTTASLLFSVTDLMIGFQVHCDAAEAVASVVKIDNLNALPAPPPGPTLVRSGRGASNTFVDIDVTGGRTLFLYRSVNSAAMTTDNPGVVFTMQDSAQRRTTIWRVAAGTTGVVRITSSTAALWAWAVVDWAIQDSFAVYTAANTTPAMAALTVDVSYPARVAMFWATSLAADWDPTTTDLVTLETITTQNAEPSWTLRYTGAVQPVGVYTLPSMSRGKSGVSMVEGTGIVTLVAPADYVKAHTFTDSFDTQVDTAKWPVTGRYGSVAWSSGRLALTELSKDYSGVLSRYILDMNESSVFCRVTPQATLTKSSEATFAVLDMPNFSGAYINGLFFVIYSTAGTTPTFLVRHRQNGTDTNAFYSYDAGTMPYLRIRLSGGFAYWDTSADGSTWTTRHTMASTLNLAETHLDFSIGQYQVEPTQTTGYFDDVNVISVPSGAKFDYYNGSAWAKKPVQMWNGTAWADKPISRWDGSQWKAV